MVYTMSIINSPYGAGSTVNVWAGSKMKFFQQIKRDFGTIFITDSYRYTLINSQEQ